MKRIEKLKSGLEKRGFDNDYDRICWLKVLHQELKLITNKEFCLMLQYVAGPNNYSLSSSVGHYSYKKNEIEKEFILLKPDYIRLVLSQRKGFHTPITIIES